MTRGPPYLCRTVRGIPATVNLDCRLAGFKLCVASYGLPGTGRACLAPGFRWHRPGAIRTSLTCGGRVLPVASGNLFVPAIIAVEDLSKTYSGGFQALK